MNIVFYGSNESSVKFLEYLSKKDTITAVITRQDKPSGRGLEIHSSPVKTFAQQNNLRLAEIDNLLSSGVEADLGVAVAYGKILKKEVFFFPKNGTINVHFSLLPKYRGAAPMQWALINGEKSTGVTIFFIDEGLDTGKILFQKEIPIELEDDFASLENKLVEEGMKLLGESIKLISNKDFTAREQAGEPSFAPPLKKSDGIINWSAKSSIEICSLIRGVNPWPGAYTETGIEEHGLLKILKAKPIEPSKEESDLWIKNRVPGEIAALIRGKGFVVKCKEGFLLVEFVQRQNGKFINAWAFWQGARLEIGKKFIKQ
ncbi:MAG: methionyl-tRNA formyltransferase [Elusimicrobia bacterium]|nr:methionyl-tRNA formyltransferase [Elusimicrobiota bacterium]